MRRPLTVILCVIALFLLSLAVWSLRLGARLDDQRMLLKGAVLVVYALVLAFFAFRARPRAQVAMLMGIVMVLIVGEIAAYMINAAPEDPDYRQGSPYIMFAGQPNGAIEDQNIELTDLGYRDAIAMPKPANEFRVIMLGGSTVFNGSPREVSIAGALEAELRTQGNQTVRIYNWGVYSVVSAQELATILFRAVDYDPDLILVYDGSNDLTEPYFFDPRPGYPFDYMAAEGGQRIIEGNFSLYDLYAILLRPTHLGYTVFQFEIEEQITRRHDLESQVKNEQWQSTIVDQYAANLAKMCQLGQAFDFQLVAMLQPMIFFKDNLTGQEPNLLGPADYQNHTRTMYDLARRAYQNLSQQYPDCTFLDVSEILRGEVGELYVDPVHLNDAGNVIVARRLAGLLHPVVGE